MIFKTKKEIENTEFLLIIGVLLLNLFGQIISQYVDLEVTWFLFDLNLYLIAAIASGLFFDRVPYSSLKNKLASFLLMTITVYQMLCYVVLYIMETQIFTNFAVSIMEMFNLPAVQLIEKGGIFTFFDWLTTCLLVVFVLFSINKIINNSHRLHSVAYKEKGSFLLYRKPRFWVEIIPALLKAPFGGVSLVVDGKHFAFHGGLEISEKNFIYDPKREFYYRKTKKLVSLTQARSLCGIKWSIRRNCFRVFENL